MSYSLRVALIAGLLLAAPGFDAGRVAHAADDFRALTGVSAAGWTLESLDGRTVSLESFKGRPVILNFWATWCAPCRVESKWLSELQAEHRSRGLAVLGVSMDDAGQEAEIRRFVETFGVKYTVLLDGQQIAPKYGGVRYLPQTFLIDRNGRIVSHTRGIRDKMTLFAEVRAIVE